MDKVEIDGKYIAQAMALEEDFFKVIPEYDSDRNMIGQHRTLKAGKTQFEFDQLHGNIWKAHEAELVAKGLWTSPPEPKPGRDLFAEMDELKAMLMDKGILER